MSLILSRKKGCLLLGLCFTVASLLPALAQDKEKNRWMHLSSQKGDLPPPGLSTQQTASLIADLDGDGVNDFVIGCRQVAPALVWYRRGENGWTKYEIEPEFLPIEAGGEEYDIDGDGDLDLIFGGDSQSQWIWWWENPAPNFDPAVAWKRRTIKNTGARQHHDQLVDDFKGTGRAQLVFWNQGAGTLCMADIPADPKTAENWPFTELFAYPNSGNVAKYSEGLSRTDIDGDGQKDLLAGNYWFKYTNGAFKPIKIGPIGGRIASGKLKAGKYPQVVIAPGDGVGPLRWYECIGDPEDSSAWVGHDLLDRDMVHGHSLQVTDMDGDENMDILAAEMIKWHEEAPGTDHPEATIWIFYGDGQGNFRKTELARQYGTHEAKAADLDADGDLDLLDKPYTWNTPRIDVWLQNGTGEKRRKK